MAYGDTAGVDEARLDAVLGLMTAAGKLADLNAALQRGALLPATLSVTAAHFLIGDPDTLPDVGTAPVLFAVTGGGKADGLDAEDEIRYVGDQSVSRRKQTWHTQVRCYVHPHLFPVTTSTWANVTAQAANRERCLARMCDWLRADVFCTTAGTDVTLASNEQGLGADTLCRGVVREIRKMWFEKAYEGGALVFGAAVLLQHVLN